MVDFLNLEGSNPERDCSSFSSGWSVRKQLAFNKNTWNYNSVQKIMRDKKRRIVGVPLNKWTKQKLSSFYFLTI